MLNAATISMNSSSVTIQRCNLTATLTAHNSGNLSGISNKYLSGEAMVALTIFILDCIDDGNNDISRLIKRPSKIGQEDRTDKHNTNFAMKNLIKEDIIEKLEMIK